MSNLKTLVNAPALQIDKILYKDRPMLPCTRRVRRIVWNLLRYLADAGFFVVKVYDGEEFTKTATPKAAMEVIFNLDDAWFYVNREGGKEHWVRLVLGNDVHVISDYSYTEGDPDKFGETMDAFNAEDYA